MQNFEILTGTTLQHTQVTLFCNVSVIAKMPSNICSYVYEENKSLNISESEARNTYFVNYSENNIIQETPL